MALTHGFYGKRINLHLIVLLVIISLLNLIDSCLEPGEKCSAANDDAEYEIPDEVFESIKRNGTETTPEISTGQEPSSYMSLKETKEPDNFYQPLQPSGATGNPHHRKRVVQHDQTVMQYENVAFKANFSGN